MKEYRSRLMLTSLVALFPLVLGLALWNQLPAEIATHFGPGNVPNGWSSKVFTVFAIPTFLLVIHLFSLFLTLHDPKKQNISKKLLSVIFWLIPLVSCITYGLIYAYALNLTVNIGLVGNLVMGLLFLLLGNYMSKVHQNYTVGIKLPWTLSSPENWDKTHRLSSWLYLLTGLIFLADAFLQTVFFPLAAVILFCLLIPIGYSYSCYQKES